MTQTVNATLPKIAKNMELETIKDKLRKLQALVEGGVEGEARTAKLMLDKLCKQHGIALEDVLDTEKTESYFFKVRRGPIWRRLLFQCYGYVTGRGEVIFRRSSIAEGIYIDNLTAYQYAEICNLYSWHKANLQKDLKNMQTLAVEAYIQKHDLLASVDEDSDGGQADSTLDFAYLKKLMAMMANLSDNRYHKQIEAK